MAQLNLKQLRQKFVPKAKQLVGRVAKRAVIGFDSFDKLGIKTAEGTSDADCDFKVLPNFEKFNQKDEVFCRSWWDKTIRSRQSENFYDSYRAALTSQWKGRGVGFTQRDFALRNASWHVIELFAESKYCEDRREGFLDSLSALRDGPESKLEFDSEEEAAKNIKHVAEKCGANGVGITEYDDRWTYTKKYSCEKDIEKPNEIDSDLKYVIVVINAMDKELLHTVPSALSSTATGLGYAEDLLVILSLSQYLRNLGYKAVPSLNDTALNIPYAIKAGLGEYGKHGLLINPKYGPRIRIGKIFTDLPMKADKPIRFGVKEFCKNCDLCVKGCPAKAIFDDTPSQARVTSSTLQGVEKWSIHPEKCFKYWTSINTDCSVCIRVCPYNRGSKWYDTVWRYLAGTCLRMLMLDFDIWLQRGKRKRPKDYWAEAHDQN